MCFKNTELSVESDCSSESREDHEEYAHSFGSIRNRVRVHKVRNDPRWRRQCSDDHGRLDNSRCQAHGFGCREQASKRMKD